LNDVDPDDLESLMAIDAKAEIDRILSFIRDVTEGLRRTSVVVGLSGGIDSAVTASLCVEALGRDRVVGVVLPERDSSPESERLASEHAERLGIEVVKRDITPILESIGTYRMRDAVVKKIMGDVPEGSVMSLVQPKGLLETGSLGIYRIKLTTPGGEVREKRLNREGLRGIISSTNTKQRTRMMMLYLEAEKRGSLVGGTTNRTETLLGFFVKYGDGGVDIEPLSHLYKTQVYEIARYLEVPKAIIERAPSPDTFPDTVTDEDFYFRMDYPTLDRILLAWELGLSPERTGAFMGRDPKQIERAFEDARKKYEFTKHLREMPYSIPHSLKDEFRVPGPGK